MAARTQTRPAAAARPDRRALLGAAALALVAVAVLLPFLTRDPPPGLTGSNAPWTDEGFNLANARNRVLFGRFHTDDVDRSLTNGAYSGLAALVYAVTGPSIPAGRAISVAAVAAAVLLAGAGLARPLGARGALLAAAALGGCQLLLQYGRLGFTEPLTVALLTGALVLAARAPDRPSWKAGAGAGVLFAVAISVKAIALVAAAATLAVLLGMALLRRDRAGLRMGLAALAGGAVTAGAWLALVALPNLDRLRVGLKIWPAVQYPGNPVALVRRLGAYLTDADQALVLAGPLLLAAAAGVVLLAARWRTLTPARRDLLLTGLLWGAGSWGAIAIGDYAPNRYMTPALPGLAVLAGAGLAWLAGRRALVAAALGLAVALPGTIGFATRAAGAGDQLGPARRALTRVLPGDAVVYGSYCPTMLFGTRARCILPWAPAGANVDDPAGRFGVTHVLADERGPVLGPGGLPVVPVRGPPLATVAWGPHTLTLYAAGAQAGRPGTSALLKG